MFYIVEQKDNKITILDSTDNTKETVSLEFVKKLQNLINIKNISQEQIILDKMLGIETIIFTKDDTNDTARRKIENISEGSKIKVYNFSNIIDMTSMFEDCQATTIDLSNFDTSNVTNMKCMFQECQATSLNLSNFDTSNVTNMRGMFAKCKATSLDLSNFDTSKVTNMEGMFFDCQATSLDLSSFDTSNVEYMNNMFSG